MQKSFGSISVLLPDGDLACFGAPSTRGTFMLPFPSERCEDDKGRVRFTPSKEPDDGSHARFPSASEFDFILSHAPRHERGAPASTRASIARRLGKWELEGGRIELPPRDVVPALCVAERIIETVARLALEAYGLAAADIDPMALRTFFRGGAGDFPTNEEITAIVERAASDPAGCLYEFDSLGAALDREHEMLEQQIAASRAEERKREAEDDAPNDELASDLGVVVFSLARGAYTGRPRFAAHAAAHYSDAKRDYYMVSTLAGLDIPPQTIGIWPGTISYDGPLTAPSHEAEVLPDHVPACTKRVARSKRMTLTPVEIRGLRDFDRSEVTTSFRDLSTSEGRHAAALGRKLLKPIAERIFNEALQVSQQGGLDGHWFQFATDVLIRGLRLRSDVAKGVMSSLLEPFWKQTPAMRTMIDGETVTLPKSPTPPCCDDINWLRYARASVKGGPHSHVGVDECFTAPEGESLTPVGEDPWRAVLSEACAGRTQITTVEIEALIGHSLNAKETVKRVKRILKDLGFEKERVSLFGLGGKKEYRAYVKVAS